MNKRTPPSGLKQQLYKLQQRRCNQSHLHCELTVKRGVSFLTSTRDTSIPITPRINWFWCWEERQKDVFIFPSCRLHLRQMHEFTAPPRSCRLWSWFYWRQAAFQWWPDPAPDGGTSKHTQVILNRQITGYLICKVDYSFLPEHRGKHWSTGRVWPPCLPEPWVFPGHPGTPKQWIELPRLYILYIYIYTNYVMEIIWNIRLHHLCVYSDGSNRRNLIEVTWMEDHTQSRRIWVSPLQHDFMSVLCASTFWYKSLNLHFLNITSSTETLLLYVKRFHLVQGL